MVAYARAHGSMRTYSEPSRLSIQHGGACSPGYHCNRLLRCTLSSSSEELPPATPYPHCSAAYTERAHVSNILRVLIAATLGPLICLIIVHV